MFQVLPIPSMNPYFLCFLSISKKIYIYIYSSGTGKPCGSSKTRICFAKKIELSDEAEDTISESCDFTSSKKPRNAWSICTHQKVFCHYICCCVNLSRLILLWIISLFISFYTFMYSILLLPNGLLSLYCILCKLVSLHFVIDTLLSRSFPAYLSNICYCAYIPYLITELKARLSENQLHWVSYLCI